MDPAPSEPAVSPQLITTALTATDTPMAVADALAVDCPLVWVNRAFAATSGYPVEQTLGRNARFLQGPGTDPATVARLHYAVRAGDQVRVRLRNYRPDGSTWWNETHRSATTPGSSPTSSGSSTTSPPRSPWRTATPTPPATTR